MKYLVYLTYCITSKKYYIGVHMTKNPEVWDFILEMEYTLIGQLVTKKLQLL